MIRKKLVGLVVIALFLLATAGAASAATLDLPKWVIVPEDSTFSDVTLFCGLDAMDTTNNVTPCYFQGSLINATIVFNSTTEYPKLATGRIGNAFEFRDIEDANALRFQHVEIPLASNFFVNRSFTIIMSFMWKGTDPTQEQVLWSRYYDTLKGYIYNNKLYMKFVDKDTNGFAISTTQQIVSQKWYSAVFYYDHSLGVLGIKLYDDTGLIDATEQTIGTRELMGDSVGKLVIGNRIDRRVFNGIIDEFRVYLDKVLTDNEIKLILLAGRKKLSEPAQFRQIFSPMIDLTRDRATFYAGLEVSTSDPNGYVPVPESAVNMSITSAEKLKSDYTGADFYYQGHYWYRADKIQFNLPIQFETVRESGGFSKEILLDKDSKTFVYEKEFKVTNPTAAKLNVVYKVDPTALGFSVLQYPQFELDGVSMAEWSPSNSSTLYLIRTDSLEPGEISTHWIRSVWTLTKEELDFPAKLDDFRSITDWTAAQRMAENAAEGKTDTYVKVIKITSNADVSNVTVLVPLKDVEDENDVIEAVALTGSRETLQVEKLEDGKIVVKVPSEAFVSGHAEIKVLYNKSGGSWFSQLLEKIRSLMKKILSLFGLGGG